MAIDPELETVRRTVTPDTTKSIKRTLLTCLLIRATRRPRDPVGGGPSPGRRRTVIALAVTTAGFGVIHWWPLIMTVLGHIGR
jgi:hypothetical protein